jgi:FtsP/CotA-like multicopper oxidase with cupredoxin domain
MHFHGHVFQVKSMDGVALDGAMRDTVLVMPNSTLAIQFDADNPGVWPLHCHILYHLDAGMFTVVRYSGFVQPLRDTQ